MRIIETKVYLFEKLTPKAQERAIEALRECNVDFEWLENVYEDAERIGLKITSFDDQNIEGKFTLPLLKELLEDYRIMLRHEYDYQTSDEVVRESIIANEWEFTVDGRPA